LIEEKKKNNELNSKYINLNRELQNAKKTISDLNTKLSNYKKQKNEKIEELQKIIDIKNQEIYQLNLRINNNSSGMIVMPGDKVIGIGFMSVNQKIQNYVRVYKDTEIFSRIEEELYNEYPEFKEKETYLMIRANKIKRFKSLKENNIRNGDIIQVHIYDEEI
jgi:septal ring factor EnvC (AmiA/AmiB activator)